MAEITKRTLRFFEVPRSLYQALGVPTSDAYLDVTEAISGRMDFFVTGAYVFIRDHLFRSPRVVRMLTQQEVPLT